MSNLHLVVHTKPKCKTDLPHRTLLLNKRDGADTFTQNCAMGPPAFCARLAAGQYTFHWKSAHQDGIVDDTATRLTVEVAPPPAPAWTFSLRAEKGGAGIAALLQRSRLRHIARSVQRPFDERAAERERIARDLHDTLLQSVQGLILGFRRIAMRTPETEPTRRMMEETLATALDILEEARDKVGSLRLARGARNDLAAVLRTIGERLASQHGNAFSLLVSGPCRALAVAVHDEVQLIAREALNNAFNHGDAQHVEVKLVFTDLVMEVVIADDGRGIAAESAGRAGHWGIPGMRERARRLGAELELSSGPGAGTRWSLRVPLRYACVDGMADAATARPAE